MPRTKTRADFRDQDIRALINFATSDYLAARKLLTSILPTQGAIQSITAIEKLFKALNLLLNNSINAGPSGGHSPGNMAQQLVDSRQIILTDEDLGFILYADNIYQLRYPDNLNTSFELYIPSNKYLEALDLLFCKLMYCDLLRSFSPGKNLFDVHVFQNDQNLIKYNSYFNRAELGSFSALTQYYTYYYSDGSNLIYFLLTSDQITYESNWDVPQFIKDEVIKNMGEITPRLTS